MEMINRCLEISTAQRAEIKRLDQQQVDQRHFERKAMIAERKENHSAEFGNRKQRRRQAALARQGRELA